MKYILKSIILAFLFVSSNALFSQRNNFQTLNLESGLPNSTINCIVQDPNGYIWMGMNGGGLCRFDGIHFKSFQKSAGFSADIIHCLMIDKKGRIWAGTQDEGIIIYDGYGFKKIDSTKGLKGSAILTLTETSNGEVIAGTDNSGINKITLLPKDSFKIRTIDESKGLSNNSVFSIYPDEKGYLWLATFGGINIVHFTADTFEVYQLRAGRELPSDMITNISSDNKGKLWVGTYDQGVFTLDPPQVTSSDYRMVLMSRKITPVEEFHRFNTKQIWSILHTKENEFWFASVDNGIVRLRKTDKGDFAYEHYTTLEGLPGNQEMALCEDNLHHIWIGTNGDGLVKFMGDRFSHYSEKDGLSNNKVQGVDEDSVGTFWLATAGGGLVKGQHLDTQPVFKNYTVKDGLQGNSLLAVVAGKTKTNPYVWSVVVDQGISKFDGKKFTSYTDANGLLDNSVYSISVDKNGILWCGSKEGISRYDGVKFLNLNLEKMKISAKDVNAIVQDENGIIWFGTRGGLAKYSGQGSITTYDEVEGLTHREVKSIAEGPDGNIWIGTRGGIYKYDKTIPDSVKIKIVLVANDSLLSSNNICSLIFDNEKNLIIGTDKGFDKIVFTPKGIKVSNYSAGDGFTGIECNDNAIYKDVAGNIWFGTIKGLTRYNYHADKENNQPPIIHITNLKLAYKDVDWKTRCDSVSPWFNMPCSLELKYFENRLSFQVSAISLDNPLKIKYRYQLQGWEEDWSPVTTLNERDYPMLPPGTYTFKVIACGANGIWSPVPATFHFTISPPWYRTWWFYSICGILIIAFIILYVRIRERNLIREKKILEDKVRLRTAEVVKQKEEIEIQKEEIEEKSKDITASINYAQKIQHAILPDEERWHQALPESFILFKPRDIVSGDFYWFSEIEEQGDKMYLLAAADCTGHGVPGAFMSMINTSLLNQAVNEVHLHLPGQILNEVRKRIISSLRQTGESGTQKDGMDIALVRISSKEQNTRLHYAGANNSMYIIRNVPEAQIEEIDPDPMPVAISDRTYDFKDNEIILNTGDMFYIFSDGFADQFGGPKGKKFKYSKFKELLVSVHSLPTAEQEKILRNTIEEWMNCINPDDNKTYEQIDDILVIGVRV